MHPRRPSPEHQEAVSRRLALLSAELAAVRPGLALDDAGHDTAPSPDLPPGPPTWRPAPAPTPILREPQPLADDLPLVPVPGRHASRRAGRAVAAAIPETLRGRVLLGPGQVTVAAVLVAVGLAVTCWWVVRSDAGEAVAPVAPRPAAGLVSAASPAGPSSSPSPGAPLPVGATGSASGAPAATGQVTVDVAGKVRHPGIAVLDAGARVVDALKAAGGARRGVDLSSLNLARPLVDGEQILVGVPIPPGLVASAAPAAGATAGALVNINTASQEELETLPDVGPVTAEAIIAWRTEHGGFTAVDELLEVDGIGDATLSKLAPHVTV